MEQIPDMFAEWREGQRYGDTYLYDWCETKSGILNHRTNEEPDPPDVITPWHGQNYFNWARDPANWREERG